MSDVIQFPLFAENPVEDDHERQGDLTAGLWMSDLYDTTTPSENQQTIEAVVHTGWSNQDLADLYRAQRLLALAGIRTEIDQGQSDEGDPWFIFMDANGEVFVHFSRIDGMYMVTSLLQDGRVWAENLHDLVSQFSHKIQPVVEANGKQANVVSLAQRNTVIIHPAAALAALVWSVYLMSDQLVNAAPFPIQDIDSADLAAPSDNAASDLQALSNGVTEKAALLLNGQSTSKASHGHNDRDADLGSQLTLFGTHQSMKVVGLGLSLVALSFGIPLNDPDNELLADSAGQSLSFDQIYKVIDLVSKDASNVEVASHPTVEASESLVNPLLEEVLQQEANAVLETTEMETQAKFTEALQVLTSDLKTAASAEPRSVTFSQPDSEDGTKMSDVQDSGADSVAVIPERSPGNISISSVEIPADTLQVSSKFEFSLKDVVLADLDVIEKAEFDQLVSATDTLIVADALTYPSKEQFDVFGENARKYIDFLLQGDNDIKLLALPTEVIFVDVDALGGTDETQPIYTMSWSLDDGGTISTIGLKSDFQSFDLIA